MNHKFVSSETGLFSGYAATFNTIDATGDLIVPGAFAKCIAEKGCDGISMLWQHQSCTEEGHSLQTSSFRTNYVHYVQPHPRGSQR